MEFAEIRQPHPDWPWTLSEGGNLFRTFTWKNIEYDLAELYPDNDSFLILEQKDPADETRYWFIQSAIALKGPQKDFYIVGVGWNGPEGGHLMERCGGAREAVELFRAAWRGEHLDFTGFEDQSDMLPGNS